MNSSMEERAALPSLQQQKHCSTTSSNTTTDDPRLAVLPYSVTNEDDPTDQIIHIVSKVFSSNDSSSSDNIELADFDVRPLLGGLSNKLFVVSSPFLRPHNPVLVRIHPSGSSSSSSSSISGSSSSSSISSSLVNHSAETALQHWLAEQAGLAPRVYACFQNGRIEELHVGHEPLQVQDMVSYGPAIATLLRQLHALDIPSYLPNSWQERGWQWLQLGQEFLNRNNSADTRSCSSSSSNIAPTTTTTTANAMWKTCQAEWTWATDALNERTATQAQRWASHVVLAHGDCQSLNVLVSKPSIADDDNTNKSTTRTATPQTAVSIHLIDFEYASAAPRAVDLANTFCEYCDMNNLKANYAEEYPTLAQQVEFLQSYTNDNTIYKLEVLEEFASEINKYTIVSHLQWAIWSIVRHFQSKQGFDYLAYAQQRLDGYRYHKKLFWSAEG